jgi:hypothetical protein
VLIVENNREKKNASIEEREKKGAISFWTGVWEFGRVRSGVGDGMADGWTSKSGAMAQ